MPRELHGKTIIITGASAGIGAATAWACAQAGLDVVLAARRQARIEELARKMVDAGYRAMAVPCDVSRDQDIEHLVAATVETFGRIDAVFANAGYGLFGSILDTTEQQMRDIWEVNFFGTIRLIKAAVPVMLKRGGGHVLICSSAASEFGLPMYGHYSATKAAQDSIASALRAELFDKSIYVSTIHPIGTRTEFWEVASQMAQQPGLGLNTPEMLLHDPSRVARDIVRCLRRPRPEVWPSSATRFGLALTTAFPSLGAWAARRMMRRHHQSAGQKH